jgi:hypothetical protein
MKNLKIVLGLTLVFLFNSNINLAQGYKDYLDPKWELYYDNQPSGIETKFTGVDFIRIVESVGFVPKGRVVSLTKGDINLFKKLLLNLPFEALQQMSITGNFYSRTKKHDDYFYLYNSNYKQISKDTWDKYCPYLIPLMDLDGSVVLK